MADFGSLAPFYQAAGAMPLSEQSGLPTAPIASKWQGLPASDNIDDRRGDDQWLRLLIERVAPASQFSWDQWKEMAANPFTPVQELPSRNVPLLPQGPLSRAAGYDDIPFALAPRQHNEPYPKVRRYDPFDPEQHR